MLREMLACSNHEKLHTQTYLYMHTYMHTRVSVHKLVQTHTCTPTLNWVNSGGRPRMGAFTKNLSMYNTRWTGPAVAASLSPLQLAVLLE